MVWKLLRSWHEMPLAHGRCCWSILNSRVWPGQYGHGYAVQRTPQTITCSPVHTFQGCENLELVLPILAGSQHSQRPPCLLSGQGQVCLTLNPQSCRASKIGISSLILSLCVPAKASVSSPQSGRGTNSCLVFGETSRPVRQLRAVRWGG